MSIDKSVDKLAHKLKKSFRFSKQRTSQAAQSINEENMLPQSRHNTIHVHDGYLHTGHGPKTVRLLSRNDEKEASSSSLLTRRLRTVTRSVPYEAPSLSSLSNAFSSLGLTNKRESREAVADIVDGAEVVPIQERSERRRRRKELKKRSSKSSRHSEAVKQPSQRSAAPSPPSPQPVPLPSPVHPRDDPLASFKESRADNTSGSPLLSKPMATTQHDASSPLEMAREPSPLNELSSLSYQCSSLSLADAGNDADTEEGTAPVTPVDHRESEPPTKNEAASAVVEKQSKSLPEVSENSMENVPPPTTVGQSATNQGEVRHKFAFTKPSWHLTTPLRYEPKREFLRRQEIYHKRRRLVLSEDGKSVESIMRPPLKPLNWEINYRAKRLRARSLHASKRKPRTRGSKITSCKEVPQTPSAERARTAFDKQVKEWLEEKEKREMEDDLCSQRPVISAGHIAFLKTAWGMTDERRRLKTSSRPNASAEPSTSTIQTLPQHNVAQAIAPRANEAAIRTKAIVQISPESTPAPLTRQEATEVVVPLKASSIKSPEVSKSQTAPVVSTLPEASPSSQEIPTKQPSPVLPPSLPPVNAATTLPLPSVAQPTSTSQAAVSSRVEIVASAPGLSPPHAPSARSVDCPPAYCQVAPSLTPPLPYSVPSAPKPAGSILRYDLHEPGPSKLDVSAIAPTEVQVYHFFQDDQPMDMDWAPSQAPSQSFTYPPVPPQSYTYPPIPPQSYTYPPVPLQSSTYPPVLTQPQWHSQPAPHQVPFQTAWPAVQEVEMDLDEACPPPVATLQNPGPSLVPAMWPSQNLPDTGEAMEVDEDNVAREPQLGLDDGPCDYDDQYIYWPLERVRVYMQRVRDREPDAAYFQYLSFDILVALVHAAIALQLREYAAEHGHDLADLDVLRSIHRTVEAIYREEGIERRGSLPEGELVRLTEWARGTLEENGIALTSAQLGLRYSPPLSEAGERSDWITEVENAKKEAEEAEKAKTETATQDHGDSEPSKQEVPPEEQPAQPSDQNTDVVPTTNLPQSFQAPARSVLPTQLFTYDDLTWEGIVAYVEVERREIHNWLKLGPEEMHRIAHCMLAEKLGCTTVKR